MITWWLEYTFSIGKAIAGIYFLVVVYLDIGICKYIARLSLHVVKIHSRKKGKYKTTQPTYVVGAQKNRLTELVPVSTQNSHRF